MSFKAQYKKYLNIYVKVWLRNIHLIKLVKITAFLWTADKSYFLVENIQAK